MSDAEDLFDDAAEEDEEEVEREAELPGSVADSSEEEEEEGDDEYDTHDGFLVHEGEDEEPEESDEEAKRKKKKKRKRERELVLEEEDYELLAENQVVGIRRPQQERRRIRKKSDGPGAYKTAEDMKKELFGLEEDGIEDDFDEPLDHREEDYDEGVIDDDEDDFIDDDLDGNRTMRKKRLSGVPEGVSGQALAEATQIFGDISDMLQKYEDYKRLQTGDVAEDHDDELDYSDEEAADQIRAEKEDRRRLRMLQKAQEQIDPEMMRKHHLLPEDQIIRDTDLPEREQLLRTFEIEADLEACARWVYDKVFGERAPRRFERWLVECGCREVEGPPPDGREQWDRDELEGGVTDLGSRRGVYLQRPPNKRAMWLRDEEAQTRLRKAILDVLRHMWEKHEELPFVAMYRKEICGELLSCRPEDLPVTTTKRQEQNRERKHEPVFQEGAVQASGRRMRRWEMLWLVHSLSVKWRLLQKRKQMRLKVYEEASERATLDDEKEAVLSCVDSLENADTIEMVEDVEHKFRLVDQMSPDNPITSLAISGGPRRRQKTTGYSLCRKANLQGLVQALGLTPAQFAENLEYGYKRHEPEDPREPLEVVAESYCTELGGFDSAATVIRGARYMAAVELAAEPGVRQAVRDMYYKYARLSTEPTAEGEVKLDPFHPCAIAKRLRGKPVLEFEDSDQFLKIYLAEKEGLIKVKLKIPDDGQSNILEQNVLLMLRENYQSNSVSAVSESWNKLRSEVLFECVVKNLLPSFERELRQRLLADAKEVALRAYSEKLWRYATQPPVRVVNPDYEEDDITDFRIMACCWGPGRPGPPTTFIVLDSKGFLLDMLHCPQLSGEIRKGGRRGETYNIFEDQRKKTDAERIREFIKLHTPHVVVVGASSMNCKKLKEDVELIRDYILEYMASVLTRMETRNVDIRFADDTLAQLWENSAAAREEFPDEQPIIRRGLALGRFLLDPLAVLSSLCGTGKEVLAMNLHPLQKALSDDNRIGAVEHVLITAVNQVGVDINDVCRTPWRAPPLQFVCGLGPRKASALLKAVQRQPGRCVESREALWRELGVIGKLVFKNCAAFLKVLPGLGNNDLSVEELDNSRVHPLHYKPAKSLATLAVTSSGGSVRGQDPVYQAFKPRFRVDVERLDLVKFNEELMEENPSKGNQLATLIDIQMELLMQYGDWREDPGPPKEDEVFWMICGEREDTLKEGKRVEAVVRFVTQDFIVCTLNDGSSIEAILHRSDISSSQEIGDCRDLVANNARLQTGDTLQARVKKVEPQKFQVLLTTASSALNNERQYEEKYCKQQDNYYHVITEQEQKKEELEQKRKMKAKSYIQRNIRHPFFKNMSMAEAIDWLQNDPNVECVFRPSSKGVQQISLSVKIFRARNEYGLQFQHFEIKEGPKTGALSTQLGLSTPLTIELPGTATKRPEKYEDLDEVVARFVEPYLDKIRKLQTHRKWSDGKWQDIQQQLKQQKMNSSTTPYALAYMYDKPGIFCIGYFGNTSAHRQCFSVTPEGYYFRGKVWKSVDHMLAEFKRHPDKSAPDPQRDQQAAARGQMPRQQAYGQPPQQARYGNGAQGSAYHHPYPANQPYGGGNWSMYQNVRQ